MTEKLLIQSPSLGFTLNATGTWYNTHHVSLSSPMFWFCCRIQHPIVCFTLTYWQLTHLCHDVSFRLHVGYVVAPSEHLLRYTLHRQDLPVPPATNLRRVLQS